MHEITGFRGPEVTARNFRPADISSMRGDNQTSHGAKSGTVGVDRPEPVMFCSNRKVTVTLALWVLLSFGIHIFQAQLMASLFLIKSSNHTAHEVRTVFFVVIG